MLFNSFTFLFFFIIVYGLYLRLGHRGQNRLLLAASLVFYGAWSWKFLFLLFLTSAIDFYVGLQLSKNEGPRKRKLLILLSIVSNLTILGFFKYYNFFISSLVPLLEFIGIPVSLPVLNIVLPVGISFYTFQAMSYTIDVYRKDLPAIPVFSDFLLFITFFPQLVAGPIERATHLAPQILRPRVLSYEKFYEGFYLFFWGLFQKIVIADNLAVISDSVFTSSGPYPGAQVLVAIYAFTFQIFCDFSGYSDMARGLGKMMGFDIMVNFNLPYFASNPQEFWKRWHISLSTWLRDYLYLPLGGNRGGTFKTYRNLVLVMLLGGLWHGAAWHFVLWGAYHGLLLMVHRAWQQRRPQNTAPASGTWKILKGIFFFHLVVLGWLFFRASSLTQIGEMLQALAFRFEWSAFFRFSGISRMAFLIFALLAVQLLQWRKNDLLAILKLPAVVRWTFYTLIFHLMVAMGAGTAKQFIYFQF